MVISSKYYLGKRARVLVGLQKLWAGVRDDFGVAHEGLRGMLAVHVAHFRPMCTSASPPGTLARLEILPV